MGSLEKVAAYLAAREYEAEVIVVENGSTDDTAALVDAFVRQHPGVAMLRLPRPAKGAAVRAGVLAATGRYRFLCDADLAMPIEQVARFLPPALDSVDIAIGTREGEGAHRYQEPFYRHIMGRVFNTIVRAVAVRGINDTQCGFKCFTAEAAQQLFPRQRVGGFGFDLEILFLAQRRGMRIVEVPIDWYHQADSKVRPVQHTLSMLAETASVRWNYWRGRYA